MYPSTSAILEDEIRPIYGLIIIHPLRMKSVHFVDLLTLINSPYGLIIKDEISPLLGLIWDPSTLWTSKYVPVHFSNP